MGEKIWSAEFENPSEDTTSKKEVRNLTLTVYIRLELAVFNSLYLRSQSRNISQKKEKKVLARPARIHAG